ncbi:MAG TPA: hypothetical protein VMD06_07675 [Steroidobacteraceae bacterium]|nr:hypothetical protein [Steroidobacteraceae bacterium]
MQSQRLRRDARLEVNLVRCLSGSDALAAAIAQTAAGILALAAPGLMMRQEMLSQALANDKRRRRTVHVFGPDLPWRHPAPNAPGQHARPCPGAQATADLRLKYSAFCREIL